MSEELEPQVEISAEALGVDQASFDKYHKDGQFNWQGYSKELEYKIQQRAATEPASSEVSPEIAEATASAQAAVDNAGLDWDTLSHKLSDQGDLDDSDFQALANAGIPEDIARNHVRLLKSDMDNTINDVFAQFGGEAAFTEVLVTLKETQPQDVRDRIDTLLFDPLTRPEGVAMAQRLAGTTPVPAPPPQQPAPAPVGSRSNPGQQPGSTQGFNSIDEVALAMNDPRYKTDPGYRAEVERKAMAGTFDVNPRRHTSGL